MKLRVPYFRQEKDTTCGPACLRMIMAFEGMSHFEIEVEEVCETSWLGNTCEEIGEGAKKLRFEAEVVENMTIGYLTELLQHNHPIVALVSPSVLYGGLQGFGHFVLITGLDEKNVYYHDPDLKEGMSKEISLFFSAWEKYLYKGVKVWKSMKR